MANIGLDVKRLHTASAPDLRDATGWAVAVGAGAGAGPVPAAMRAPPLGAEAAVVGSVLPEPPGMVLMHTAFGGSRVVDMLVGDPLPRIC